MDPYRCHRRADSGPGPQYRAVRTIQLSHGEVDFSDKLSSALRYQFGGHKEEAAAKKGNA